MASPNHHHLTTEEKQKVQKTLNKFSVNAVDNMAIYYEVLLKDFPRYRHMFYHLKSVASKDIHLNKWLRTNLCPMAGALVTRLVSTMDDDNTLTTNIHELVALSPHVKNKLKTEDYMIALKTLVKTMQMCLGNKAMTDADVDAWMKLFALLKPMIEAEVAKNS